MPQAVSVACQASQSRAARLLRERIRGGAAAAGALCTGIACRWVAQKVPTRQAAAQAAAAPPPRTGPLLWRGPALRPSIPRPTSPPPAPPRRFECHPRLALSGRQANASRATRATGQNGPAGALPQRLLLPTPPTIAQVAASGIG